MKITSILLFVLCYLIPTLKAQEIINDTFQVVFEDGDNSEVFHLRREFSELSDGKIAMDLSPIDNPLATKPSSIVWKINVQAGSLTVLSNYSEIPRDDGTEFNLDAGTILNYRLYLSMVFKQKHEIRFLYAPLSYSKDFTPDTDIQFRDSLFMLGTATEAFYKFNSYRLSYIYHFNPTGKTKFRLGFTGKIRDAETALKQASISESFTDIGFVPLLHFGVELMLTDTLSIDLETEGSWAPQGYAVDSRLSLDYRISKNVRVGTGIGYLDGGANVESVNTFARLFYGYARVQIDIPYKKNKK